MIQNFQCPVCGNLNALGEPACTVCGQSFFYNCPVCGNPINNRCSACPSCKTLFNWSREPTRSYQANIQAINNPQNITPGISSSKADQNLQENIPVTSPAQSPALTARQSRVALNDKSSKPAASITSRPMFWVMLMIACIILIAVLLLMDRIISA